MNYIWENKRTIFGKINDLYFGKLNELYCVFLNTSQVYIFGNLPNIYTWSLTDDMILPFLRHSLGQHLRLHRLRSLPIF